jgi:hypothetical protein
MQISAIFSFKPLLGRFFDKLATMVRGVGFEPTEAFARGS